MFYCRILTLFLIAFLLVTKAVSAQGGDVNCNEIITLCKSKLPRVESREDSLFYMKNLALAYLNCSNFEEAFTWYEKSYKMDSTDLSIKFDMALSASRAKKYLTAIRIYRDLQNSEIDDCSLAIGLGNALYKAGMIEESIETYEDYYPKCSSDIVFLNNLGISLIETNHFKEAEDILKQATEIDTGSFLTTRNLAYLYLMNENFTQAKELLDMLLQDNPKDKFLNYYLGLYYENNGKYKLACRYYKEASKLGHLESSGKFTLICNDE